MGSGSGVRALSRAVAAVKWGPHVQPSFSQCGEDRIVKFILYGLKVDSPTYLDIGAHCAKRLNNTYLFYLEGGTGVCVEPNPVLYRRLKRARPKDVCLPVGVGPVEQRRVPLYVMRSDTLSTFSEPEAKRLVEECGERIVAVEQVDIVTPNMIFSTYFAGMPDFVSLDIEGAELEVLKAVDFGRFRPKVFCVETLSYVTDGTERKNPETVAFLASQGYFLYADTYVNSIFVDEKAWRSRGGR